MGLYELGEAVFGMIIFMNIMLMAFGGLTSNGFILQGTPTGIVSSDSIDFNSLNQNGQFNTTPYITATVSGERSAFLPQLIYGDIQKMYAYVQMGLFGFAIAIHYIGLPAVVEWLLVTPMSIIMLFYTGLFLIKILSAFRGALPF